MKRSAASPALWRSLKPVILAAVAALVVFVGGFGAWAAYAPLASAAIAPGVVSPESRRKTVAHLEGGIVEEILVKDGDQVERGDLLMRLSPTQARSSFAARARQFQRRQAERARLVALLEGNAAPVFDARPAGEADEDFQSFLATQQALFARQSRLLKERNEILARQIGQIDTEIAALARENAGLAEQAAVVDQELADKQDLLAQQLTPKSEVLALTRLRAELKARLAANDASIARTAQRREEVSLTMLASEAKFYDDIANELVAVNGEIAQLEEAMTATEDVFRRTEIRAPVAGTVLNLAVRTLGGIVQPGEALLEIVPAEDRLVIEARLSPNDIDMVAIGQPARVHLTPYASRDVPPLLGRLTFISPDSTYDERTQQTYYALRVEVDPETITPLPGGVELSPGMPAEVFIVTGEQSLFAYFAAPVARSFRRAFTEE